MAAMFMGLAAATACDSDDITGPNDDIVESIRTDAHIMAAMHESNMSEIQAGTVAMQRAADNDVRAFGEMMIVDHTVLAQQGGELATELGITPALPDDRLLQLQEQEMEMLNATEAGETFDKVYINQQIIAHVRTLELVDAGIARTSSTAIRTMLQQARPMIAQHLELARDIQDEIGEP